MTPISDVEELMMPRSETDADAESLAPRRIGLASLVAGGLAVAGVATLALRHGQVLSRTNTEMMTSLYDFDCDAGFSNWKRGWSDAKKDFCCDKGVAAVCDFDCDAGLAKWKTGWSDPKKEFCCKTEEKGCDEPFDCDAGFPKWKTGWSGKKKAYCCKAHKKGCEEEELFDCDAGFPKWKTGWSGAKKDYCCEKHQKGCEDKECADYMGNIGCSWTADYPCEGQSFLKGLKKYKWDAADNGIHGHDESRGWTCCCVKELWKEDQGVSAIAGSEAWDTCMSKEGVKTCGESDKEKCCCPEGKTFNEDADDPACQ